MGIGDAKSFEIGGWRVTPDEDTISRDGRRERLEPLAMRVLVYLASRAGEVVSRSDLEEAVWKGGVVSYDAVTSTVIKLRKALGDDARRPAYIATIPKRGYQLIAAVSAAGEQVATTPVQAPENQPQEGTAKRRLAAILMADMVDYSRRLETDEPGTIGLFNACVVDIFNPSIQRHGGRTVRLTGDGALVEFPSAVEATQCAIDIQRGIAECNASRTESEPVAFRMGISIGDVVEDADNLHGSGINIAARLEGQCKPGHVLLSEEAAAQVEGRVDAALQYLGERRLKNIERKIRVWSVDPAPSSGSATPRRGTVRIRTMFLAVASLAVFAAVIVWLIPFRTQGPATPQDLPGAQVPAVARTTPVIAVLPFENLSGDVEQEYFSDGMTEDLLTDLSKIPALRVIARTSAFAYKSASPDIPAITRSLKVSHVVVGSVRKLSGRVRITVKLIDARSGEHLWAERYDREIKDIFALQDEVRGKIVSTLAVKLAAADERRIATKGTASVQAYDLLMKGRHQEASFTRTGNAEAIRFYEKAIEVDPNYAKAYARLANMHELRSRFGWSDDANLDTQKAFEFVQKAMTLDDSDPFSHWTLARIYSRLTPLRIKNLIDAMQSLERAIELEPNYADAHAFIGHLYIGIGKPNEALKAISFAMELNPQYPFWYIRNRGLIHLLRGDYEAAIADLEEAAEKNSTTFIGRWWLAAAYAQAGRQDDAEWQIEEIRALGFQSTIEEVLETSIVYHPPYVEILTTGLRGAGVSD